MYGESYGHCSLILVKGERGRGKGESERGEKRGRGGDRRGIRTQGTREEGERVKIQRKGREKGRVCME